MGTMKIYACHLFGESTSEYANFLFYRLYSCNLQNETIFQKSSYRTRDIIIFSENVCKKTRFPPLKHKVAFQPCINCKRSDSWNRTEQLQKKLHTRGIGNFASVQRRKSSDSNLRDSVVGKTWRCWPRFLASARLAGLIISPWRISDSTPWRKPKARTRPKAFSFRFGRDNGLTRDDTFVCLFFPFLFVYVSLPFRHIR